MGCIAKEMVWYKDGKYVYGFRIGYGLIGFLRDIWYLTSLYYYIVSIYGKLGVQFN